MGIALWVIGFFSPIHTLGDDLLSAHMAQHLLIADLAAPLLLAGVRNPVLMFYLPRPALITLARSRLAAARVPVAATAAGGDPDLHARSCTAGTSRSSSRPPCATRSCTRCST